MELEGIGRHCSLEDCQVKDFLPFQCQDCLDWFCVKHRTPGDHQCVAKTHSDIICPICSMAITVVGIDADYAINSHIDSNCSTPERNMQKKCEVKSCRNFLDAIPFECKDCHIKTCSKHRHADEHNCEIQIQPKASPVQSTRSLIQQRYGQQPATPVNKQTSEGAQRAIKKLKIIRQSTGQSNIPKESRIHLEVIFPLVSGVPSKFLFFNKAWTVGKVLDVIASEGNIINKNNVAGEEKLYLYDVSTGEPLPNSSTLASLAQKKIIFDGTTVLLEKPSALVP